MKEEEEDPKQCWSKDTALLDTAADREGLRCRTIVHNCTLHVLMEGDHHAA